MILTPLKDPHWVVFDSRMFGLFNSPWHQMFIAHGQIYSPLFKVSIWVSAQKLNSFRDVNFQKWSMTDESFMNVYETFGDQISDNAGSLSKNACRTN